MVVLIDDAGAFWVEMRIRDVVARKVIVINSVTVALLALSGSIIAMIKQPTIMIPPIIKIISSGVTDIEPVLGILGIFSIR